MMGAQEDSEAAIDWLDGFADKWAEEINLTSMIKNVVSPMNLNPGVPKAIREKFKARMEAQIDAIVRQAFVEALVRHLPSRPSCRREGVTE